jgi:hypothetical protein
VCRALPGHDRQFAIAIHARIVIRSRQREDPIQMIAFHPVLNLARLVARVCAHLEHGHDNNLDRNRRRNRISSLFELSRGARCSQCQSEQQTGKNAHGMAVMLRQF